MIVEWFKLTSDDFNNSTMERDVADFLNEITGEDVFPKDWYLVCIIEYLVLNQYSLSKSEILFY
jgi:hypothetical protein